MLVAIELCEGYFLHFIPCVERDEEGAIAPFSVKLRSNWEFLCRLFDIWFRRGFPLACILTFEHLLQRYPSLPGEVCLFEENLVSIL